MTSSLVLGILALCTFVIFLVLFIGGIILNKKNDVILDRLPTVCAGSFDEKIPKTVPYVSLKNNDFISGFGLGNEKLKIDDYDSYVVSGNSMQFGDIHTDDLVFVPKGFQSSDLNEFPAVIVLRNSEAKDDKKKCQFKLRRAWERTRSDMGSEEIKDMVSDIMNSSKYKELKNRVGRRYGGDDVMLDDFTSRWDNFQSSHGDSPNEDVIISTTYDVKKKKIHFSIHRASSVVGIVKYVSNLSFAGTPA